jgi:catalase
LTVSKRDAKLENLARSRWATTENVSRPIRAFASSTATTRSPAGERGPTLIEDFHFREKLTRFDHERIPERVVHARGAGAYGTLTCTESLASVTQADFLSEAGQETPVFVRFSTVGGSRGSAYTVRDVRGFATKFYTHDGNFDIVGNNMPVFFIQDGIVGGSHRSQRCPVDGRAGVINGS